MTGAGVGGKGRLDRPVVGQVERPPSAIVELRRGGAVAVTRLREVREVDGPVIEVLLRVGGVSEGEAPPGVHEKALAPGGSGGRRFRSRDGGRQANSRGQGGREEGEREDWAFFHGKVGRLVLKTLWARWGQRAPPKRCGINRAMEHPRQSHSATVVRASGREHFDGNGVIDDRRAVLNVSRNCPGIAGTHLVIDSIDVQDDVTGHEIPRLFLRMLMGGNDGVLCQLELRQLRSIAFDQCFPGDSRQGADVPSGVRVADSA